MERPKRLGASWFRTDAATAILIGCVIFICFFSSTLALRIVPENWQADDGCYLQHLGDYIGIEGDDICQKPYNYFPRGVALAWIAPGLIGKAVGHLLHESVTTWILPFVALGTYVIWALGIFLVIKILRATPKLGLAPEWVPAFAIFVVFSTYSLYYGTVRVFMAHGVEMTWAFACLYFVPKDQFVPALLFAVLTTVTRYNDAPIILLLIGRMLDQRRTWAALPTRHRVLIGGGAASVVAAGAWIALYKGYYDTTFFDLLADAPLWSGFREFTFSNKWGMLWSGWWWLGAWVAGMVRFRRLSWLGRGATIWLSLEALLAIVWNGNGSDFGYRYLIGSYAGALAIWLEVIPEVSSRLKRVFQSATVLNGVWVMLMTMIYMATPYTRTYWDTNGTCYVPQNMTARIFENLLNPTAYAVALARQVVPATLYFSSHPGVLSERVGFTPVRAVEAVVLKGACGVSFAYVIAFLAGNALLILRKRRVQ
jgi:hypothetical protein